MPQRIRKTILTLLLVAFPARSVTFEPVVSPLFQEPPGFSVILFFSPPPSERSPHQGGATASEGGTSQPRLSWTPRPQPPRPPATGCALPDNKEKPPRDAPLSAARPKSP
jgi:hypothetical protein